jgi:hypothetical protein
MFASVRDRPAGFDALPKENGPGKPQSCHHDSAANPRPQERCMKGMNQKKGEKKKPLKTAKEKKAEKVAKKAAKS